MKAKPSAKPTTDVLLQLLGDCNVPYAIASRPGAGFDAVLFGEPAPSSVSPTRSPVSMSPSHKDLSAVVDWLVDETLRRNAYSDFAAAYREIAPSGKSS